MAYHFNRGESVPEAIRRVVREELQSAARQLRGADADGRDEAIHEARKSIKKIRGALKLMRPELGDFYRAENARMRDIGRQLSEFRDAGAMLEIFDALLEKYGTELGGHSLAPLRMGLAARKEQGEQRAGIEQGLSRIAADLDTAGTRVKTWPLATGGFDALAPGLARTFRAGRKALERVERRPRAENYHEWRKRVKDHWYHIRLFETLWTETTKEYEKQLKDLEDWLGEDHNLVVLAQKIRAEPAFYGRPEELRVFRRIVARYHKELRGKALEAGASIYHEKPRRLVKRMRNLWDSEPPRRTRALR